MKMKSFFAALLVAAASSVRAEKISNEFKAEFERTFRPKQTYAVVMREEIPTTSVYGTDGRQTDAHFSVDVIDGRWKVSDGLLDFNQTAADTLGLGEILELSSISYKDNRIDMRFVSVEAHKVRRGDLYKTEKREPVATNFKFFFPFEKRRVMSRDDMVEVLRYTGDYLRVFASEDAARAYAAKMTSRRSGGDEPRGGGYRSGSRDAERPEGARERRSENREIKVGMTPLDVIDILGKPQKETTFQNSSKWTYPDLTVIFESGKVKEVRF